MRPVWLVKNSHGFGSACLRVINTNSQMAVRVCYVFFVQGVGGMPSDCATLKSSQPINLMYTSILTLETKSQYCDCGRRRLVACSVLWIVNYVHCSQFSCASDYTVYLKLSFSR